jgi:hypothetical protein
LKIFALNPFRISKFEQARKRMETDAQAAYRQIKLLVESNGFYLWQTKDATRNICYVYSRQGNTKLEVTLIIWKNEPRCRCEFFDQTTNTVLLIDKESSLTTTVAGQTQKDTAPSKVVISKFLALITSHFADRGNDI